MIGRERVRSILSETGGRTIVVVGDLMLDRYVAGTVDRISPEAPVPVVHVTREHARLGGAANVALNITALGGKTVVAGVAGDDGAGGEMQQMLVEAGIGAGGIIVDPARRTTVKTRILAERQQVVRVDRESSFALDDGVVASL
jgi:D-glycero-beta-D-manno-heptose-7-phosphate kinase